MIKGARLTEADAEAQVHGICFKTGPPERVGVELEWLVRDRRDPALPVRAEQVAATLAGFGSPDGEGYMGQAPHPVPHKFASGASLTLEPGGQLELSSAPAGTLGELHEVTGSDLAALRDAAAAAGLELCGYGLDPIRPPRRLLDLPRYAAMEKFFDREGPWGRQMMCGTASVQVCLDAGDDSAGPSGYRSRWRLLHAIGPVLVAAFANSPLRDGKPTGWRSARQQVWANMDPRRTRAPGSPGPGKGAAEADAGPLSAEQFARAAGLEPEQLADCVQYGLLNPDRKGRHPVGDLPVARAAAGLARHGIEPRHLRVYRSGVEREAGLVEQLVAPVLRARSEEARTRATEKLRELADPSTLTCPECQGVLSEVRGQQPLRFRCQIGHARTAQALEMQRTEIDDALRILVPQLEVCCSVVDAVHVAHRAVQAARDHHVAHLQQQPIEGKALERAQVRLGSHERFDALAALDQLSHQRGAQKAIGSRDQTVRLLLHEPLLYH